MPLQVHSWQRKGRAAHHEVEGLDELGLGEHAVDGVGVTVAGVGPVGAEGELREAGGGVVEGGVHARVVQGHHVRRPHVLPARRHADRPRAIPAHHISLVTTTVRAQPKQLLGTGQSCHMGSSGEFCLKKMLQKTTCLYTPMTPSKMGDHQSQKVPFAGRWSFDIKGS